jgi:hypothetical protein
MGNKNSNAQWSNGAFPDREYTVETIENERKNKNKNKIDYKIVEYGSLKNIDECMYCLENGDLIHPCPCKYVHYKCLKKFNKHTCEICDIPYKVEIKMEDFNKLIKK